MPKHAERREIGGDPSEPDSLIVREQSGGMVAAYLLNVHLAKTVTDPRMQDSFRLRAEAIYHGQLNGLERLQASALWKTMNQPPEGA